MSFAQKTPMSRTLNRWGQRKALEAIERTGLALPGAIQAVSGSIVTINFEVDGLTLPLTKMPVAMSRYARLPIQVGDLGMAMPSDYYLGGISGLGGGTADTTQPGNLSALVWVPVANSNFPAVDPNAVVLTAPNGVVLKDDNGHVNLTLPTNGLVSLTSQVAISLTVGSQTIVINTTGVFINGKQFLTHEHTGVTTGGGVSGPVS